MQQPCTGYMCQVLVIVGGTTCVWNVLVLFPAHVIYAPLFYLLFAFKTMLIKVFTLMKSKAKYIFTSSMNYSLIPLFSLL